MPENCIGVPFAVRTVRSDLPSGVKDVGRMENDEPESTRKCIDGNVSRIASMLKTWLMVCVPLVLLQTGFVCVGEN